MCTSPSILSACRQAFARLDRFTGDGVLTALDLQWISENSPIEVENEFTRFHASGPITFESVVICLGLDPSDSGGAALPFTMV